MFVAIITSLFHLALPLGWLLVLAVRAPRSWVVRALNLAGSALYIAFFVEAGVGWPMLGWYARWALVALAVPLWLLGAARARGNPARPRGFGGWASATGALLVTLLMGLSVAQLVFGAGGAAPLIADIQNPLADGVYLVSHGGANPMLNHHASVPAQRYALDIMGMNAAGFRARGLAPTALEDYVVYGTPVHAPCAGEVLVARDGLENVPVGLPGEAGREQPAGNTVLIHCASDITVVLAHLKPHSVRVVAGDKVEVGRELGAVGNTGNTSEPHLHLHAVRGRVSDVERSITDAEPVLLRIDGRFPVRNDRLVVSDPTQLLQAAR